MRWWGLMQWHTCNGNSWKASPWEKSLIQCQRSRGGLQQWSISFYQAKEWNHTSWNNFSICLTRINCQCTKNETGAGPTFCYDWTPCERIHMRRATNLNNYLKKWFRSFGNTYVFATWTKFLTQSFCQVLVMIQKIYFKCLCWKKWMFKSKPILF